MLSADWSKTDVSYSLVWCTPAGSLYGASGENAPGVGAFVLEDFDRAAPKGTGSGKLAGNYAP